MTFSLQGGISHLKCSFLSQGKSPAHQRAQHTLGTATHLSGRTYRKPFGGLNRKPSYSHPESAIFLGTPSRRGVNLEGTQGEGYHPAPSHTGSQQKAGAESDRKPVHTMGATGPKKQPWQHTYSSLFLSVGSSAAPAREQPWEMKSRSSAWGFCKPTVPGATGQAIPTVVPPAVTEQLTY